MATKEVWNCWLPIRWRVEHDPDLPFSLATLYPHPSCLPDAVFTLWYHHERHVCGSVIILTLVCGVVEAREFWDCIPWAHDCTQAKQNHHSSVFTSVMYCTAGSMYHPQLGSTGVQVRSDHVSWQKKRIHETYNGPMHTSCHQLKDTVPVSAAKWSTVGSV